MCAPMPQKYFLKTTVYSVWVERGYAHHAPKFALPLQVRPALESANGSGSVGKLSLFLLTEACDTL